MNQWIRKSSEFLAVFAISRTVSEPALAAVMAAAMRGAGRDGGGEQKTRGRTERRDPIAYSLVHI